ncbi:unnamed protein product, partial [Pylaiella littoralis]
MPSADVSVMAPDVKAEGGDGSLTAGLAAGGAVALGGIGAAIGLSGDKPEGEVDASMPSVGDLSADVGATVDDITAKVPDVLTVEVKRPKKRLFGSLSFKKPSSKGKIEVPKVDAALPDVSGDVSAPDISATLPEVSGGVSVPDVPSAQGDISGNLPSADVSVTAPDVKAEGGDGSLAAGLAAGGAAAWGGIGAAIGLSGDKPEGEVDASMPSVEGKKPKKRLFGSLSFKKP